jgi:hypothetical protein
MILGSVFVANSKSANFLPRRKGGRVLLALSLSRGKEVCGELAT